MDLDDTMTTSTSSSADPNSLDQEPDFDEEEDDDDLFPDNDSHTAGAIRPHTPTNDHLNASAPGELSPPRSYPQQMQSPIYEKEPAISNGQNSLQTSNTTANASQKANDSAEDKPGYAWKNKKAQEEMQRAWDNIVDRDFSLKEYGDVMMRGKAMER